jgi:glycosyltransferase involved in cell wall biosynthesis
MQSLGNTYSPTSTQLGLSSADDIVCFGSGQWFYVPSIPEYTMLEMASKHRVLYVEPFVSFLTVVQTRLFDKNAAAFRPKVRWGLRRITSHLTVYTPPPLALPFQHRFEWILRINMVFLAWLVRGVMRRLGFSTPILWAYLFRLSGMVGRLSEKAVVYDCIEHDEHFVSSESGKRKVRALEERLCRKADVVFVMNPQLHHLKGQWNPRTVVVPSGAKIAHFSKAADPRTPIAEELAALPRPIVGYFGQVDRWKIDFDLLIYLTQRHPDWSLVFVGPVAPEVRGDARLTPLRNVYFFGRQPYERIPSFLKGFDVCTMPFTPSENIELSSPLKLYEYLATGKPIVSVPFPAVEEFSEYVSIARSSEAFAVAVEQAYTVDTQELASCRMREAEAHSWERRVEQKRAALHDVLIGRAGQEACL